MGRGFIYWADFTPMRFEFTKKLTKIVETLQIWFRYLPLKNEKLFGKCLAKMLGLPGSLKAPLTFKIFLLCKLWGNFRWQISICPNKVGFLFVFIRRKNFQKCQNLNAEIVFFENFLSKYLVCVAILVRTIFDWWQHIRHRSANFSANFKLTFYVR